MNTNPDRNIIARSFNKPFSEGDVLYLQDLFMTPGVHQINVDSVGRGRSVIYDVLESLHYHHNAACLSLDDAPLKSDVFDILQTLIVDDYLVKSDNLTLFFLDYFYFDFLWIEESQNLLNSIWYQQFKKHLAEFNFDKSIPIIKIVVGD